MASRPTRLPATPCTELKTYANKSSPLSSTAHNKRDNNAPKLIFEGIELLVQNIDNEMTETILFEEFSEFGQIAKLKIVSSGEEVKKKRYGVVTFLSPADAHRAVKCMNGVVILTNTLFVTLASERTKRRRPSPTPHTQRFNTLLLLSNAHQKQLPRRKVSAQELCHQIPIMMKLETSGDTLIDVKQKLLLKTHARSYFL